MKILEVETIPHASQRYPTCGDYSLVDGQYPIIKVSQLSEWQREMLVAVHELVELILCRNDGVTHEDIDAFDMEYEKKRGENDDSEPGDQPGAPYHRQHFMATNIERQLAAALGVNWSDYEKELQSLG